MEWKVAFAGRSNVGKSSLINTLSLATCARSANTPGYTQSLHFYGLKDHLNLVDMPGYGYASAGYDQVDDWNALIDGYLCNGGKRWVLILGPYPLMRPHPIDLDIWDTDTLSY